MSKRSWRPMMDLKLRSSDGKSFQDFFSEFFSRLYPDDFIRVRPHGNRGDGGVDGFRQSDGTVYQCYGAREGYVHRIDSVSDKMKADFETARISTRGMRRWLFTHNLTDVPRPLLDAYQEVLTAGRSHGIEVGMLGPQVFQELLKNLDEEDLEDLLGIRPYNLDEVERLPETVNLIIRRMIEQMDVAPPRDRRHGKPPVEKFDYNDIPPRWRNNLTLYLLHAPLVRDLLASFPDGATALIMPDFMRLRYVTRKAEGFDAGGILKLLHEELAGYVNEHDGRYEAAMAVLAAMFESCVIFEDKVAMAAEPMQ
uniref:ABC-three component systems C-terminal domain-containing protein n=1 Tax=Bosea sp. NBC_00436 TaxID=2969620 RepID=A0A9E7ZZS4_9HYPH